MNFIWILLATTVVQYLVSEMLSLFDLLARWLVRRSAASIPMDKRTRYLLEWEAELQAIPGSGLLRLLFAMRVRLGARAMARELGAITRLGLRSQLARAGFMAAAALMTIFLLPLGALLAVVVAACCGRPILRSRIVRARDGSSVTLYSFNAPAATVTGRFLDATDLVALPSLLALARGRIWPTSAQLRIVASDLLNGRPTQPFSDRRP